MNNQFIRDFREILRRLEREIFYQSNESCCSGITLAQCHTLLEIEKQGNISVSELAHKLDLDKSTVSRTVDGLTIIGLIDRSIPPENRRMAIVCLTNSGEKVCDSINSNRDRYYLNALKGLSYKESSELLRLLTKLTSNMSKLHGKDESICV